MDKARQEINQKSTLNAFPRPLESLWFKCKEYINDTGGARLISKVRAGNYGVGNTYMKIKNCQLCGVVNMNHESHLIMKCEELKEGRCTTDIGQFNEGSPTEDDISGHRALRNYLDPKNKLVETLAKRAQYIQHILKTWEKKVNEMPGTKPKTYCHCKQPVW
jgi:hypothetical protein